MKNQNKQPDILKKALSQFKMIFVCAFFFSLVISLLTLAMPIYSLQVLDRVLSSSSLETLTMLSIIVVAAFICLSGLTTVRSFIFNQMAEKLDKELSPEILKYSISHACVQPSAVGSQMLRDFQAVKNFLASPTLHSLLDAPWVVIFIAVIFYIHPINGVVIILSALFLLFMAWLNHNCTQQSLGAANEAAVHGFAQVESATRNAEVVEAMGMKHNLIHHWNEKNLEALKEQRVGAQRSVSISSFTKFFRLTIQMAIMGVGAYLVINRQMSPGGIIATSILAGKALAPFDAAIGTWKSVLITRKSYQRMVAMMSMIPNREEGMALPTPTGVLDVEQVVFKHQNAETPTLKGITFHVEPGQSIGMIGPSGSGKTTLAKLLVGVWPCNAGLVRLDQADIYRWNRQDIGSHIGYLPQDVELFAGTIKDNIARMDPEANPEEIVKAAQIAGAHELILKLPKGYETHIGVSGNTLSSGQKQRIGLARVFYGQPKLIVLDEPNAHLDTEGDAALLQSLQYAKHEQITVVIIAHRPSILDHVDKILVLQEGQVAMFDDRHTVMDHFRKGGASA